MFVSFNVPKFVLYTIAGVGIALSSSIMAAPVSPNGIEFPKDYRKWEVLGVSHRSDKESLRLILANPVAMKAAINGKTHPWPDGSILAKVAWKDHKDEAFSAATVPDELGHVEFMLRDSAKFAQTQGWGYARWLGMDQKVFGTDESFAQECAACHQRAEKTGYVFTRKVPMP